MKLAKGTHRTRYPVVQVPFLDSVFGYMIKANLDRTGDHKRLAELSRVTANQSTFDPVKENTEIHTMEMSAGQFFIFNERTMHLSGANTSKNRRLGMNFRVTTPDVEVYSFRRSGDFMDGEDYDIAKHGCLMLSGEDRFRVNTMFNDTYAFGGPAEAKEIMAS